MVDRENKNDPLRQDNKRPSDRDDRRRIETTRSGKTPAKIGPVPPPKRDPGVLRETLRDDLVLENQWRMNPVMFQVSILNEQRPIRHRQSVTGLVQQQKTVPEDPAPVGIWASSRLLLKALPAEQRDQPKPVHQEEDQAASACVRMTGKIGQARQPEAATGRVSSLHCSEIVKVLKMPTRRPWIETMSPTRSTSSCPKRPVNSTSTTGVKGRVKWATKLWKERVRDLQLVVDWGLPQVYWQPSEPVLRYRAWASSSLVRLQLVWLVLVQVVLPEASSVLWWERGFRKREQRPMSLVSMKVTSF